MFMNNRGFTLVEVVVSLAILGLGMAIVLQIFSGGLENIHRIRMAHRAMNHAENVMNELLTDHSIKGPIQLDGDLDDEFAYSVRVKYWEPPEEEFLVGVVEPEVYLLLLQVNITSKNIDHGKSYRSTSLKSVSAREEVVPLNSRTSIQKLFTGL